MHKTEFKLKKSIYSTQNNQSFYQLVLKQQITQTFIHQLQHRLIAHSSISSLISNPIIMSSYSYLFKYIIIGDTSVGKSCMLLQFLQKKFKFDHDSTIGVEFGSKVITAANKPIKLQIWDTAGQQTFKSITRSYYRGSIGVILVYDITSRQSFNNVNKWLDETKSYSNDKITMLLVGNKSDLDFKRTVSYDEGFQMAKKSGMLFMQCSAKSGQNIDSLFLSLTETIDGRIQKRQIDPKNQAIGIKLGSLQTQRQIQKKKKKCC